MMEAAGPEDNITQELEQLCVQTSPKAVEESGKVCFQWSQVPLCGAYFNPTEPPAFTPSFCSIKIFSP